MAESQGYGPGPCVESITLQPPTPRRRAQAKPLLSVRTGHEKLAYAQALHPAAVSVLTPPPTPQASSDSLASSATTDDRDSASFYNYLRAFCNFQPNGPIDSDSNESSITIPITEGDVVLVHSIQPNGWADGTVLTSGARGWLPTNYCEPYDPETARMLLNALTYVWEFIRGHETDNPAIFTRQDYVRGMIAGVRVLLERTGCLNRDSPLVSSHPALRRMRKTLLGELSAFAKSAKALQETCQKDHVLADDVYEKLDATVFKAFKVVTRAVRLLDVWTHDICLKRPGARVEGPAATPPPLTLTSDPSPTNTNASRLQDDRVPPVTPTSSILTPASDHILAGPAHLSSPAPSSGVEHDAVLSSSTRPSPHDPPSSLRPSSALASKRISASHRLSAVAAIKSPSLRYNALASERLCSAHDAFLGHLGAFIGLHLQSRSSMDLLVSTQHSVVACQTLLNVVEEIWERDLRRSTPVDDSRLALHQRLTELVHATKDILKASDGGNEADVHLPEHGRRLVEAATMCVRSAGDCVAKSRNVIERIGDFESEPAGLAIVRDPEQHPTTKSLKHEKNFSVDKPLPTPPGLVLNSSLIPEPQHRPPPPPPLERASSSHSDCTSSALTPSILPLRHGRHSIRSSSLPRGSSDTVIPRDHTAPPTTRRSGIAPNFLTLDIDIPYTSFIDMSITPTTPSPDQVSRQARADSGGGDSVTDSASTYFNSLRQSGESAATHPSTRATTPEHTEPEHTEPEQTKPEPSCGSLQDSTGSLGDAQAGLAEDSDDAEAQVLAQTYAHELVYNKDGQVTGGSLPALVEQLTTHDSTPDIQFVTAFYLTFRLFTTPTELAQTLVDRYERIGDDQEFATPVRLRVYNVFKSWLETNWRSETDDEALRIILTFANGPLRTSLPSAARRLAELANQLQEMQRGSVVPAMFSNNAMTRPRAISSPQASPDIVMPSPIISRSQLNLLRNFKNGSQVCTILDLDPLELARQFTIMQVKVFCAIQPEELLGVEWTKKTDCKAVNVRAMSALSTDLANLVADTILQLELKKRAVLIKQWVKIATRCLELGNYDALMAIICSLNSSMVLRLKKTWDLVSPKTLAKLDYLKTVVDVSRNYAVLRQRLAAAVAPCLPFVGIYLTDLTFVDAGNQATRQLPGAAGGSTRASVINFDKHVKTAKIIADLQRFQAPYRLQPVPEMQEWMESQISRVRNTDQASVQNYYRRSLMLEPRENAGPTAPATSRGAPVDSATGSFASDSSSQQQQKKEGNAMKAFDFWGTLGSKKEVSS